MAKSVWRQARTRPGICECVARGSAAGRAQIGTRALTGDALTACAVRTAPETTQSLHSAADDTCWTGAPEPRSSEYDAPWTRCCCCCCWVTSIAARIQRGTSTATGSPQAVQLVDRLSAAAGAGGGGGGGRCCILRSSSRCWCWPEDLRGIMAEAGGGGGPSPSREKKVVAELEDRDSGARVVDEVGDRKKAKAGSMARGDLAWSRSIRPRVLGEGRRTQGVLVRKA